MQRISTGLELKLAIAELEQRQSNEWPELKEQFGITIESLKPLNIIKNTIKDVTTAPDFKGSLLGVAAGMTTGYLSKVLIAGQSKNPIKRLFANFVQLEISNIVSRNPETIKFLVKNMDRLFTKKEEVKAIGE